MACTFGTVKIKEDAKQGSGESKQDNDDVELVDASFAKETDSVRDSMINLLLNPIFSDVTLLCADKDKSQKKIAAHRAILAARSTTLAALFQSAPEKDEFKIEDTSFEAMSALVSVIYGSKKQLSGSVLKDVVSAADKYGVKAVQTKLGQAPSMDNIFDLLSSEVFSTAVLSFVSKHASDIVAARGWLALPAKAVEKVSSLDQLSLSEMQLFKAVLAWGKEEVKRQKASSSSSSSDSKDADMLQTVLKDIAKNINYGTMDIGTFTRDVSSTNALGMDLQVAIFGYLGTRGASSSAVPFRTKPRSGSSYRFAIVSTDSTSNTSALRTALLAAAQAQANPVEVTVLAASVESDYTQYDAVLVSAVANPSLGKTAGRNLLVYKAGGGALIVLPSSGVAWPTELSSSCTALASFNSNASYVTSFTASVYTTALSYTTASELQAHPIFNFITGFTLPSTVVARLLNKSGEALGCLDDGSRLVISTKPSDQGALVLMGLLPSPSSWSSGTQEAHLLLNTLKYFAAQCNRGRAASQLYLRRPDLTNSDTTLTTDPVVARGPPPPPITVDIICNGTRGRPHMDMIMPPMINNGHRYMRNGNRRR